MVGQDTAGKVAIGERGLGERVGEGEKSAKGARGLGGEGVRVEKEAEESKRGGSEQVVGVKGGVPTLLAPWVRGVCDCGDGGGKAKRSSPSWVHVWGESARGHIEVPSHLPPLGTWVGRRTEVGGGAGCE